MDRPQEIMKDMEGIEVYFDGKELSFRANVDVINGKPSSTINIEHAYEIKRDSLMKLMSAISGDTVVYSCWNIRTHALEDQFLMCTTDEAIVELDKDRLAEIERLRNRCKKGDDTIDYLRTEVNNLTAEVYNLKKAISIHNNRWWVDRFRKIKL